MTIIVFIICEMWIHFLLSLCCKGTEFRTSHHKTWNKEEICYFTHHS